MVLGVLFELDDDDDDDDEEADEGAPVDADEQELDGTSEIKSKWSSFKFKSNSWLLVGWCSVELQLPFDRNPLAGRVHDVSLVAWLWNKIKLD